MKFLLFLIGVVLWTGIGYLIMGLYGTYLTKKLIKHYKTGDDMGQDIVRRHYEKTGSVDVSLSEILFDALTWPITIIKAEIGQRKIVKNLEESKNERN